MSKRQRKHIIVDRRPHTYTNIRQTDRTDWNKGMKLYLFDKNARFTKAMIH